VKKPKAELRRDVLVVVLLQLAGLAYGLYSVYWARPVHLVFEYDRFRAVHASEVAIELAPRVPAAIEAYPLNGPGLLSVRGFSSAGEKAEVTMAALAGLEIAARPDMWEPYSEAVERVLAASRPIADLWARYPNQFDASDGYRSRSPDAKRGLRYLPMSARKGDWTVIVDGQTGQPVGFVPLDAF
jgi:hypothetical protein